LVKLIYLMDTRRNLTGEFAQVFISVNENG